MKPFVLIVDDEFALGDLLRDLLVERGYDVQVVINGQLGLDAISQSTPDVILLDVMMPIMDGPEMLRRLRADEKLRHIPVIYMSSLPSAIPDEGLHQAALSKPFSLEELIRNILLVLAPKRRNHLA